MDIISYAKASQTLKGAKKYDEVTVAPGAEDRFETVDERIDYLENKLIGRYEEKIVEIDLKDGTFTNTQLDKDQNLSLKMINKNVVPDTKNHIFRGAIGIREDPYNIYKVTASASADHAGVWWNISDGGLSSSLETSINLKFPLWVQIEIEKPVSIKRIKTYVNGYGKPGDWVILGSINGINWDTLYSNTSESNPIIDIEIMDNNIKEYKYIRYQINSIRSGNRLSIQEVEIFKAIEGYTYASQGTWESNVIDLGGEWIETKYLKFTQNIAESHSITKEISYSDDGITFSDYELYDAELVGQHRFIKVRLELTSTDEISDTTDSVILSSIDIKLKGVVSSTPVIKKAISLIKAYTFNGYLENIERLNTINFEKLEFKSDSLINAQQNQMHNLVIDVFNSDSMESISSTNTSEEKVLFIDSGELEEGLIKSIKIDSLNNIKGIEV